MKIQGSVALVTGANRGLGAAFAQGLLAAGASKVYAAARDPATVTQPGVIPVRLDVTRPDQVELLAPEDVVRQARAALEAGAPELFADDTTRSVHAGLTSQPPMYVGMGA